MNKQQNLVVVVFLGLILIIVVLGVYYVKISTQQQATGKTTNETIPSEQPFQNTTLAPSPTPTIMKVPFDYEVTGVTADNIELNGQRGKLLLPKDPSKVKVYSGQSKDNPIDISAVKVGQKATIEAIPGKMVWLYIIQ